MQFEDFKRQFEYSQTPEYKEGLQNLAFNNLNKIKKYAAKTSGTNDQTRAHRKHLIYIVEKALDT